MNFADTIPKPTPIVRMWENGQFTTIRKNDRIFKAIVKSLRLDQHFNWHQPHTLQQ